MIRVLLVLAAAASTAAHAQQVGGAAAATSQYGVTRSKDTVTVGESFMVRVRVRAPVGATIQFPENPDTTGTVQARDPRIIQTSDSVQSLDQTASYQLAAWDVGAQPVRLDDVVVTSGTNVRRIPLGGIEVFVRSVLPADTALRVPKPARAIWETRPFPWWLLALLLAAIATGVAIWWWMHRRRRVQPVVVVPPYERAQREFNRVEGLGLVPAGERTRFVVLMVEVLREYLAARYSEASLALTSRELVSSVRRHAAIPVEHLSRVLHEVDLAKFAGWELSEERATKLGRDVRAIVEHEHRASQPPDQAAA